MPRNQRCELGCDCGRHSRVRMSADERRERDRERQRSRRAADPAYFREYERGRDRRDYDRERGRDRRQDPAYQEYHREYGITWRAANAEKGAAYSRRYREANPVKAKANKSRHRARNLARIRVTDADYKMWQAHRLRPEQRSEMVAAQDGRCCYCQLPLSPDRRRSVVDHDHTCSCGPKKTCQFCRRGIACDACNKVIGLVFEDWDRLERIAASGRILGPAARDRIAGKPAQGEFPIDIKRAARQLAAGGTRPIRASQVGSNAPTGEVSG